MPTEQRTCQQCGAAFSFVAAPSTKGKGRFCSHSCHAKSRIGERNTKWRGGRIVERGGRIKVYAPDHPGARLYGGSHIYEYRLIAEEKIGRMLLNDEVVHHINGNPADNRPENLVVMTAAEHARLHCRDEHGLARLNVKLTESDVRQIRVLVSNGTQQKTVATTFGVDPTTVNKIILGQTWRHVQ